jgi:hypothetical protein
MGAFPVFVMDGEPSPLKSQARAVRFFRGFGLDLSALPSTEADAEVQCGCCSSQREECCLHPKCGGVRGELCSFVKKGLAFLQEAHRSLSAYVLETTSCINACKTQSGRTFPRSLCKQELRAPGTSGSYVHQAALFYAYACGGR